MSAEPYQRCSCRDPETRRELGQSCPKLKAKGHARGWFYRRSVRGPDGKRRQPEEGPFPTKRAAEDHQAVMRAKTARGSSTPDKSLRAGQYLTDYAAGKLDVKQSSRDAITEAIRLYWRPALGHLRLIDVRDHHISEAVRVMLQINRPLPEGEKLPDVLLHMLAARADDERRRLGPGERRRKKSAKPLSPARIQRVYAVLHAALELAVKTHKIGENPCDGVILPRVEKVRPLPWSGDREARFWKALQCKLGEMGGDRELTTVEKQRAWASQQLRPSSVLVWLPAHTGRFIDYLEQTGERLAALFVLAAYCGLRRAEALGLHWSEIDLDQSVAFVLETADDGTPKTDAGVRAVPLPAPVVAALRAWRKVQAADQLAWGPDWPDTDLVFTREDGTAVPGQWTSVRFETLAYRAGLPPVRFHDLRHGAASLCKAAGLDTKYISALLGHSRTSFTDSTYILLFPEVAKAAADAAAAIVPRAAKAKSDEVR
jgi:integrase